jgi:hypothetical protein
VPYHNRRPATIGLCPIVRRRFAPLGRLRLPPGGGVVGHGSISHGIAKSVSSQDIRAPFCVCFPHNCVVLLVDTQSIDIRRPPCSAKKSAANSLRNLMKTSSKNPDTCCLSLVMYHGIHANQDTCSLFLVMYHGIHSTCIPAPALKQQPLQLTVRQARIQCAVERPGDHL